MCSTPILLVYYMLFSHSFSSQNYRVTHFCLLAATLEQNGFFFLNSIHECLEPYVFLVDNC